MKRRLRACKRVTLIGSQENNETVQANGPRTVSSISCINYYRLKMCFGRHFQTQASWRALESSEI